MRRRWGGGSIRRFSLFSTSSRFPLFPRLARRFDSSDSIFTSPPYPLCTRPRSEEDGCAPGTGGDAIPKKKRTRQTIKKVIFFRFLFSPPLLSLTKRSLSRVLATVLSFARGTGDFFAHLPPGPSLSRETRWSASMTGRSSRPGRGASWPRRSRTPRRN